MTTTKSIYDFFNKFSIPAYPNTSVPIDAEMPYITYEVQTSDFLSGNVSITVNVWYKTESEAVPNAKVKEIEDAITLGGVIIPTDNGGVWIKKGSPWCTVVQDTDDTVKRRMLNVTLEFLTV